MGIRQPPPLGAQRLEQRLLGARQYRRRSAFAPAPLAGRTLLAQLEALLATQAKALSVNELPASPQAAPASDARYVTSDVYLRAEPANTGAVVGVLTGCGTVFLEKADERGRGLHVGRGDGSSGWVFRAYISAAKPAPCR